METKYQFNLTLRTASLEYWDNNQLATFTYNDGLVSATELLDQYKAQYDDYLLSHNETLEWINIIRSNFHPEELFVGDFDFQLECEPNKVKVILRSPHLAGKKLIDIEWNPVDDLITFQPRPMITDLPFGAYMLYISSHSRFCEAIQGHKQVYS